MIDYQEFTRLVTKHFGVLIKHGFSLRPDLSGESPTLHKMVFEKNFCRVSIAYEKRDHSADVTVEKTDAAIRRDPSNSKLLQLLFAFVEADQGGSRACSTKPRRRLSVSVDDQLARQAEYLKDPRLSHVLAGKDPFEG